MRNYLLTSLLFSFLFLFAPFKVIACSCAGKGPVLEEFNFSQVLVAGRIDTVHRLQPDKAKYDFGAIRSAELVKVYKGSVKVGDKLVLAQTSGSDCGFHWSESSIGHEYLFYLREPAEQYYEVPVGETIALEKLSMYRTNFCGRSTGLDSAAEDLAYLDNLEKLKGKTRISGQISFGSDDKRSVEGIEVRIKGKDAQYKTKYWKEGFFEIYDVPPGEYVIEVMAPQGWKVGEHWRPYSGIRRHTSQDGLTKNERRIFLPKEDHVGLDLALIPDTSVSGRVLSPTGKPMADVWIEARNVGDTRTYSSERAATNKDGTFRFETLSPGPYRLVINNSGKVDSETPFGRLFYPGVPNEAEAGLIYVEPGRYISGLDIQIPQIQRLIEITGRFEFADGKPAGAGWIKFKPENSQMFGSASIRTDTDGKFAIVIPFGAAGTLTAEKYFWKSDYSCPQIVAARDAAKSNDLESTPISVTGSEALTNVVLKLPFDFCPKNETK